MDAIYLIRILINWIRVAKNKKFPGVIVYHSQELIIV